MDYSPLLNRTSMNLSPPRNHDQLDQDPMNLDLCLGPTSSPAPVRAPLASKGEHLFSCNYCQRKFYNPQALGGHQNTHKLERTLAKKSREQISSSSSTATSNKLLEVHGTGQWNTHTTAHVETLSPSSSTGGGYGAGRGRQGKPSGHLDLSLRL